MTICRECGRHLTDPVSVQLGIGPVCRTTNLWISEGPMDLFTHKTERAPQRTTIKLHRTKPGEIQANVPHSVIWHSPTGFEFGYGGSGPADLALNILHAWIPPGADGLAPVPIGHFAVSETAAMFHQDFKRTFLAEITSDEAEIPSDEITAWLDANAPDWRGEGARRRRFDKAREASTLNAYTAYAGSPLEGAVLVFARTAHEARRIAWPVLRGWGVDRYIDVKTKRAWSEPHLFYEADIERLEEGTPHAIDNPRTCTRCETWGDPINGAGVCESCYTEEDDDGR